MSPKIIIGIGTGRCGSQSLSELISSQLETVAFHEMYWSSRGCTFRQKYPMSNILDNSFPKLYVSYLKSIVKKFNNHADFIFDIGPYTKSCIDEVNKSFSNVKYIVLKRDFESFDLSMKKINKFNKHNILFDKRILPFKSNLEYYNYIYDKGTLNLNNSFILKTEDLNSEDKIKDLLDFLEYKNPIAKICNKDETRNL